MGHAGGHGFSGRAEGAGIGPYPDNRVAAIDQPVDLKHVSVPCRAYHHEDVLDHCVGTYKSARARKARHFRPARGGSDRCQHGGQIFGVRCSIMRFDDLKIGRHGHPLSNRLKARRVICHRGFLDERPGGAVLSCAFCSFAKELAGRPQCREIVKEH